MADLENLAEISGDQWEVTIGADNSPILAGLTLNITPTMTPVLNQRTGSTPVAHLLDGYAIAGQLTFNQWSPEIAALFLPVEAAAPKDLKGAGSVMPAKTLLFHDPNAGETTTGDLFVYAAVFGNVSTTNDGQGPKQWVVPFVCQQGAGGKVLRLGPAGA